MADRNIDTTIRKPRRAKGTPVYQQRNIVALGVLALGGAIWYLYELWPQTKKLKQSIQDGKFAYSPELQQHILSMQISTQDPHITDTINKLRAKELEKQYAEQPKPQTCKAESVSKFFKRNLSKEKEPAATSADFNSPTKIKKIILNDDDDFKTPKPIKKLAKIFTNPEVQPAQTQPKRKYVKRGRPPRKDSLQKTIEDTFKKADVNGEHLQMALALSMSAQEAQGVQACDGDDSTEDDKYKPFFPSTQEVRENARKTLEQYGFKSSKGGNSDVNPTKNVEASKRKKKSRYHYIKPVLFLRTDKDREEIINSKVARILNECTVPESKPVVQDVTLHSETLNQYYCKDNKIIARNNLPILELKSPLFYVQSLQLSPSEHKCGILLKRWEDIPGRELSPDRTCLKVIEELQETFTKEGIAEENKEKTLTHEDINDKTVVSELSQENQETYPHNSFIDGQDHSNNLSPEKSTIHNETLHKTFIEAKNIRNDSKPPLDEQIYKSEKSTIHNETLHKTFIDDKNIRHDSKPPLDEQMYKSEKPTIHNETLHKSFIEDKNVRHDSNPQQIYKSKDSKGNYNYLKLSPKTPINTNRSFQEFTIQSQSRIMSVSPDLFDSDEEEMNINAGQCTTSEDAEEELLQTQAIIDTKDISDECMKTEKNIFKAKRSNIFQNNEKNSLQESKKLLNHTTIIEQKTSLSTVYKLSQPKHFAKEKQNHCNLQEKPMQRNDPCQKRKHLENIFSASLMSNLNTSSTDYSDERDLTDCEIIETDNGICHFESFCADEEMLSQKCLGNVIEIISSGEDDLDEDCSKKNVAYKSSLKDEVNTGDADKDKENINKTLYGEMDDQMVNKKAKEGEQPSKIFTRQNKNFENEGDEEYKMDDHNFPNKKECLGDLEAVSRNISSIGIDMPFKISPKDIKLDSRIKNKKGYFYDLEEQNISTEESNSSDENKKEKVAKESHSSIEENISMTCKEKEMFNIKKGDIVNTYKECYTAILLDRREQPVSPNENEETFHGIKDITIAKQHEKSSVTREKIKITNMKPKTASNSEILNGTPKPNSNKMKSLLFKRKLQLKGPQDDTLSSDEEFKDIQSSQTSCLMKSRVSEESSGDQEDYFRASNSNPSYSGEENEDVFAACMEKSMKYSTQKSIDEGFDCKHTTEEISKDEALVSWKSNISVCPKKKDANSTFGNDSRKFSRRKRSNNLRSGDISKIEGDSKNTQKNSEESLISSSFLIPNVSNFKEANHINSSSDPTCIQQNKSADFNKPQVSSVSQIPISEENITNLNADQVVIENSLKKICSPSIPSHNSIPNIKIISPLMTNTSYNSNRTSLNVTAHINELLNDYDASFLKDAFDNTSSFLKGQIEETKRKSAHFNKSGIEALDKISEATTDSRTDLELVEDTPVNCSKNDHIISDECTEDVELPEHNDLVSSINIGEDAINKSYLKVTEDNPQNKKNKVIADDKLLTCKEDEVVDLSQDSSESESELFHKKSTQDGCESDGLENLSQEIENFISNYRTKKLEQVSSSSDTETESPLSKCLENRCRNDSDTSKKANNISPTLSKYKSKKKVKVGRNKVTLGKGSQSSNIVAENGTNSSRLCPLDIERDENIKYKSSSDESVPSKKIKACTTRFSVAKISKRKKFSYSSNASRETKTEKNSFTGKKSSETVPAEVNDTIENITASNCSLKLKNTDRLTSNSIKNNNSNGCGTFKSPSSERLPLFINNLKSDNELRGANKKLSCLETRSMRSSSRNAAAKRKSTEPDYRKRMLRKKPKTLEQVSSSESDSRERIQVSLQDKSKMVDNRVNGQSREVADKSSDTQDSIDSRIPSHGDSYKKLSNVGAVLMELTTDVGKELISKAKSSFKKHDSVSSIDSNTSQDSIYISDEELNYSSMFSPAKSKLNHELDYSRHRKDRFERDVMLKNASESDEYKTGTPRRVKDYESVEFSIRINTDDKISANKVSQKLSQDEEMDDSNDSLTIEINSIRNKQDGTNEKYNIDSISTISGKQYSLVQPVKSSTSQESICISDEEQCSNSDNICILNPPLGEGMKVDKKKPSLMLQDTEEGKLKNRLEISDSGSSDEESKDEPKGNENSGGNELKLIDLYQQSEFEVAIENNYIQKNKNFSVSGDQILTSDKVDNTETLKRRNKINDINFSHNFDVAYDQIAKADFDKNDSKLLETTFADDNNQYDHYNEIEIVEPNNDFENSTPYPLYCNDESEPQNNISINNVENNSFQSIQFRNMVHPRINELRKSIDKKSNSFFEDTFANLLEQTNVLTAIDKNVNKDDNDSRKKTSVNPISDDADNLTALGNKKKLSQTITEKQSLGYPENLPINPVQESLPDYEMNHCSSPIRINQFSERTDTFTTNSKFTTPGKYGSNSDTEGIETPNGTVIMKTRNVTPIPDYDSMDTPELHKELNRFGLKRLKRKRGVELLKYIYESTHPMVGCDINGGSDIREVKRRRLILCDEDVNSKCIEGVKSKCTKDVNSEFREDVNNKFTEDVNSKFTEDKCIEDKVNNKYSENLHSLCIEGFMEKRVHVDRIQCVGDTINMGELEENMIFEKKRSKRIFSCQLPLHIAWHNLLSVNPEIRENILLYEPLQVEVLYGMLKEQGFKYNIQDLISFLDKKCITIRMNQN